MAYGVGVALLYAVYILMLRQATSSPESSSRLARPGAAVAAPLFEATVGATAGSVVLGLALRDFHLGPAPVRRSGPPSAGSRCSR